MSPEVKCKVSDCNYWEKGEICTAKHIEISVGSSSRDAFYAEFAGELSSGSNEQVAQKAENTLCHTYEKKANA